MFKIWLSQPKISAKKVADPCLKGTNNVKISMILIIVRALTIVILAYIISCAFCYGCKSQERRYMNRDTVRTNSQTLSPLSTVPPDT